MSSTITFGDLARALRRGAAVVGATTLLFLLGAVIYLHLATETYTARMTVTAVQSSEQPMGGQLSGLASLAGISLAGKTSSPIKLYQAGLKSRLAAEALSRDEQLMRSLFAEEWDAERSQWRRPSNSFDGIKDTVRRALGLRETSWRKPDAQRVHGLLREIVEISEVPESPLTEVTVEHDDPAVALRLLRQLHTSVDASLKRRAIDRTSRYVSYLRNQLSTVTVADYRQALTAALADQEKQRMVAMSGLAYAADLFDAPTVPSEPSKPQGGLVIAIAVLSGLLFGVLIVLYRAFFSSQASSSEGRTSEQGRHHWYPPHRSA